MTYIDHDRALDGVVGLVPGDALEESELADQAPVAGPHLGLGVIHHVGVGAALAHPGQHPRSAQGRGEQRHHQPGGNVSVNIAIVILSTMFFNSPRNISMYTIDSNLILDL